MASWDHLVCASSRRRWRIVQEPYVVWEDPLEDNQSEWHLLVSINGIYN